MHYRK